MLHKQSNRFWTNSCSCESSGSRFLYTAIPRNNFSTASCLAMASRASAVFCTQRARISDAYILFQSTWGPCLTRFSNQGKNFGTFANSLHMSSGATSTKFSTMVRKLVTACASSSDWASSIRSTQSIAISQKRSFSRAVTKTMGSFISCRDESSSVSSARIAKTPTAKSAFAWLSKPSSNGTPRCSTNESYSSECVAKARTFCSSSSRSTSESIN
mmetsp:Transcript_34633/g.77435  ORF Transcript_34633/g.77435 Transcript_34633/m.77435 type:complete len:215 (+) Transcript_34633:743-1387(+)